MWLKPLFVRSFKNAKSGLRKWLGVLLSAGGILLLFVLAIYADLTSRQRHKNGCCGHYC
jgi:hypothetical protein